MKLRKRITAMALGILGCAGLLTTAAFAETGTTAEKSVIDMHDAKLTVKTFESKADGGKAIDGVNISIYQVASIDENGEYTVTDEFKEAGIGDLSQLDLTRSDANAGVRKSIRDFLEGGTAKPADSAETKDGKAVFEVSEDNLGLYYIEGDIIEGYFEGDVDGKTGKLSYIPGSALVSLPAPPNEELKTDYWDYIPTVNIKYTKGGVWIDPPVLKIVKETADPVGQGRDFTFVMQGVDGAPLPNPDEYGWELAEDGSVMKMNYPAEKERVIDKDGKTTKEGESQEFGVIWFTQPGLYEYLIYEMEETVTGYTFDKTQYHLYVDVYLNEDGTLGGNQRYEKIEDGETTEESEEYPLGPGRESAFEFTNTYTHEDEPGDKTYFDPSVKKFVQITDKALEGSLTFKFILEAKEGTPMPGGSTVGSGKVKKETSIAITHATAKTGLTADFGQITFDKPGTYSYKIYEDTTAKLPYTTFDTTVYEIEVITDGKNVWGAVKNSVTGNTTDWSGSDAEFVFNNTYTRKGGGGGGGGGGRRGGGSTPTPTTTTVPETEPEVIPGMLPKTGMLWWPVPVLAVAGFFLLAAGFILERRKN